MTLARLRREEREDGIAEGYRNGLADGEKRGEARGIAQGEHNKAIAAAQRMLRRPNADMHIIAEDLGLPLSEVQLIAANTAAQ